MSTAIFSKTFDTAEFGNAGYHYRQVIQPADLIAAPGLTLIRARFQLGGGTVNCTLDGSWVDVKGSGATDFSGTQAQFKFSGANSVSGMTGQTIFLSDYVIFTAYNPAVPLVFSFHLSGTEAQPEKITSQSNCEVFYKLSDNSETGLTAPTGFSSGGNQAYLIALIEMDVTTVTTVPVPRSRLHVF